MRVLLVEDDQMIGAAVAQALKDAAYGDTARAATSGEVKDLRWEASALKEVVADLTLENRLLKKSMNGDGEDEA
jgi:transposase